MINTVVEKLRTFRSDRSGAAMIEFAISLPILLLIISCGVPGATRQTRRGLRSLTAQDIDDRARFRESRKLLETLTKD